MTPYKIAIDAFIRSIDINKKRPICLLLGAGASISSGMPSAERCIWEWKREIFITKNPLLRDEPYRVCRRVNILRDYPDDKIKICP
ncbi:hypothetical protein BEN71_05880 [Acinetobacter wuhouensis]|nr:hypothetical protein BEN71_05880 [Acinetobacter wuhouensis]